MAPDGHADKLVARKRIDELLGLDSPHRHQVVTAEIGANGQPVNGEGALLQIGVKLYLPEKKAPSDAESESTAVLDVPTTTKHLVPVPHEQRN